MDNMKKIQEEYKILEAEDKNIEQKLVEIERGKLELLNRRQQIKKSLYEKSVALCHVLEIFRIAAMQFSRLRRNQNEALSVSDINELNKWIGRAKSEDGLKDIVNALNELGKYSPSDIKTNLYALVQKIIIGGAFKQKQK